MTVLQEMGGMRVKGDVVIPKVVVGERLVEAELLK